MEDLFLATTFLWVARAELTVLPIGLTVPWLWTRENQPPRLRGPISRRVYHNHRANRGRVLLDHRVSQAVCDQQQLRPASYGSRPCGFRSMSRSKHRTGLQCASPPFKLTSGGLTRVQYRGNVTYGDRPFTSDRTRADLGSRRRSAEAWGWPGLHDLVAGGKRTTRGSARFVWFRSP